MTGLRRPPYAPEVEAWLGSIEEMGVSLTLRLDRIVEQREVMAAFGDDLSRFDVERRDLVVPGFEGAEIEVSVFRRTGSSGSRPAMLHLHGGGMVSGDRLHGVSQPLRWVVEHDLVLVTVDYRLAPEHPDPYPVEDCYAALCWLVDNAAELDVDPRRVLLMGTSAGGGLAAGTALLARDRGGPGLLGQMLVCPMLDDRDATVSSRQFEGIGVWDRESNVAGWTALLGERRGGDEVSVYAAPARATDLSGLPPTFIDVGSAEVFRDEDAAFASRLWADGGDAELHVWPGGTHGWDGLVPDLAMSAQAVAAREAWLLRLLEPIPPSTETGPATREASTT